MQGLERCFQDIRLIIIGDILIIDKKIEETMQPYMTNQAQYHTGPIHQEIKVAGANVKDRYLQLKATLILCVGNSLK